VRQQQLNNEKDINVGMILTRFSGQMDKYGHS